MRVTYEGNLRSSGTHLASGEKLITDAPVDNHGLGMAYSPTDLLCSSLASCMFTLMGILATRKGWEIEGSGALITKIMAENPRRVKGIQIIMQMKHLDLPQEARIQLERAALTCPVAKSLHPDIDQDIRFEW